MKKYKSHLDIILLSGMTALALLAIAPDTLVMPSSVQMLLLGAVLVLLAGFSVLVWREDPSDEREAQNQAIASRTAYFAGLVVLVIALVVQSLQHSIDSTVPIALLVMVATKILVQRHRDSR